ncbi:Aldo-keto reductase [Castellaniella defragrans 65Phen]|uniref:Aldo-keto reductase n=1 Tax=Castellaniella defragrans (strain DSM 12143 / CCUG 39792 / 65Phen) TaxID=1437824 RepID=W8X465_CASD6|nr:aldo/keto reductase [Castellaniella defragrans]CDM24166.1 Aldo-keto reductase [Castellaniella defragrans 65Phen]
MKTTRTLAGFDVFPIGLGCMSLSHGYGPAASPDAAEALLLGALDRGVTLFDTAALYGFGHNEEILGRVLAPHRSRFMLASKCGIFREDGRRRIDGRPETLRRTCEDSLRRLRTDVIDLYYLHRWDKSVPIEDSVGALADLARAGKIRAIGLSEVSADTLRRAHAVHPVAAVQSEYSLWSCEVEIAVLGACRELGTALVAFSPLGRAFLADGLPDVARLHDTDLRRRMPRFQPEAYARNLALLEPLRRMARDHGCTPGQLALAWLLHQGEDVIPIPGTTRLAHLEENLGAAGVRLDAEARDELARLFARDRVAGERYGPATQAEVDTERFPAS